MKINLTSCAQILLDFSIFTVIRHFCDRMSFTPGIFFIRF